MALVTANAALEITTIDFGGVYLNPASSVSLSDNANFSSVQGRTYEDVLRVTPAGKPTSSEDWCGTGLVVDPATRAVSGGTLTGFVSSNIGGMLFGQVYAIEGFSLNAVTWYGAMASASTADDLAVMRTILAGNDTFNLSVLADNVWAWTGNDTLHGNGGNDTLHGDAGNDLLDGGSGADRLFGGAGNDTYVVDSASDVVTEAASSGSDTVRSSIAYTLGSHVEHLTLTGTLAIAGRGNELANTITGNGAANALYGGAGNDRLRGAGGNDSLDGGSGADTMEGGSGNDTYFVDNTGDAVTEAVAAGSDTVRSSISHTLGSNVENLLLTGTGAIGGRGNELANSITGNAAANSLYGGAGNDILRGGGGNDWLDGGSGADTMQGGAGNDTYVVGQSGDVVTEASAAGTDTVRSSISHTLSSHVENLLLTGTGAIGGRGNELANTITGNAAANTLYGGSGNDLLRGAGGNDTLDGGIGADTMQGATGNDVYVVDNAGDTISEAAGAGTDTVRSSRSHLLGDNLENLVLTGTGANSGRGNALANTITGNGVANALYGGDGNDLLHGNGGNDTLFGDAGNDLLDGGSGADRLFGGAGNDSYVVDSNSDVVTEAASSGSDTVRSSVAYTLGSHVEHLTLTGTATIAGRGNELANTVTGNGAANSLYGGAGNDLLRGAGGNDWLDGGSGADTMQGGSGNDTYVVDNTSDSVTESAASGTDTVRSSIGHTLGSNVENLVLTGSGAISGRGNELANSITGNAAANSLYGGAGNDILRGGSGNDWLDGGSGADTMQGGAGNDTYVVSASADVVAEASGAGTDTVRSSIGHALGSHVENLLLTGTGAIGGRGNELANTITGNAAANTLYGGSGNDLLRGAGGNDRLFGDAGSDRLDGGSGADTMQGGTGNDTYLVDAAGDTVTEAAGAGIDTVRSSVGFALGAEVENLLLSGTIAIDGRGNGLANTITGNDATNALYGGAGNDILRGNGGNDRLDGGSGADSLEGGAGNDVLNGKAGNDTLLGGAGRDAFRFDTPLSASNVDRVVDFVAADDYFALDDAVFTGIGPTGALAVGAFRVVGSGAIDATDRVLYDPTTGTIAFDADGSGAGVAVVFATVAAGTVVTAADFFIV